VPKENTILIVDDDAVIRDSLEEYLTEHGFKATSVENGAAMKAYLQNEVPNVVLLDIHMPGEDGLTLAKYLRQNFNLGIIMVTGSGETIDRVVGLEIGADDYVSKPFDLRELLARTRSVLRRYKTNNTNSDADESSEAKPEAKFKLGKYTLCLDTHSLISSDGVEINITNMEYKILCVFIERPNRVLSRDDLLNLTQNRNWGPHDRSLDIRIARIRQKIEHDPKHPKIIKTIRGAGYLFTPDENE